MIRFSLHSGWAFIFVVTFAVSSQTTLTADQWPGWMGPQRDGVYRESGIIEKIPAEGLKVKWRMPVAGGYAGPAVAGGKVFVFDYEKKAGEIVNNPNQRAELMGSERLTAFDESTGEQLWQHAYDCPYAVSYPVGPRCTPTVDGDRVYILGSEGDLHCLNTENGSVVWKKNFKTDFGAEILIWGACSHPLIDGDLLYTMVGGKGQAMVALDKMTGDVKWKSLDAKAGYAPPSIIMAGGKRQLIAYHPTAITSLDPASGQQHWSIPIEPLYDMSIARPMVEGNKMYASGIGTASVMIELATDKPAASELWRGQPKSAIFSANATPLIVDGVIYGSDCNLGYLAAVDATNGSQLWSTFEATVPTENRRVSHGTCFLTRIGDTDRFLILRETGDLLISRLTAKGYEPLGSFHALEPTSEAFGRNVLWSHPAYANRTAYIRNDKEVVAVDLAK